MKPSRARPFTNYTWEEIIKNPVLQIKGLEASYGTSLILQGIDLTIDLAPLAIVGRNGMGKTTLCRAIMGMGPSCTGSILFKGAEIIGKPSHRIAKAGIALVPQGRHIFPSLTVAEHFEIVRQKGPRRWNIDRIYQLFPRLAERRDSTGGTLSGGEQQMLAISRALLTNPVLLVMDEPSEGLSPVLVDKLVSTLKIIRDEGTSLLLIEQNLSVAAAISERVAIMVVGRLVMETTSAALLIDHEAQQRYLGIGAAMDGCN